MMLRRVLSRLWRSAGVEPVEATVAELEVIPDHESAVRRLVADAHGGGYKAIESLDEAKATPGAAIVMEGDYGGCIYLTCPARLVHCHERTLRQLLDDLDEHDWSDPEGVGLYYEVAPVGSGVAGGTGGGVVSDGVLAPPRPRGERPPGSEPRLSSPASGYGSTDRRCRVGQHSGMTPEEVRLDLAGPMSFSVVCRSLLRVCL